MPVTGSLTISRLPNVTSLNPTDLIPVVASGVTSNIQYKNVIPATASYALTASYVLNGGGSGGGDGAIGVLGSTLYSSGSSLFSGSVTVSGSVLVTGSVNVTTAINLKPQSPLPTGTTGSLATSGSHLYFYNGTGSNSGWALVI